MVPYATNTANPELLQNLLQVMAGAQRDVLDTAIRTAPVYQEQEAASRRTINEQATLIASLQAQVLALQALYTQQLATHGAEYHALHQKFTTEQTAHNAAVLQHAKDVAALRTKHNTQFQAVGQKIAAIEAKVRGQIPPALMINNVIPNPSCRGFPTITRVDTLEQNFAAARQLCNQTI